MTRQAQWYLEPNPSDPWRNMALDASLLTRQIDNRDCLPLVRIYEWDQPAISIGRLQQEEMVRRNYPDLPCVRRPTGGRAVLHGNDLTISVVLQAEWLISGKGVSVISSYRAILDGVIWALQKTGHQVNFGTEKSRSNQETIHCFEVAAGCDLVDAVSRKKIAGCAQRRVGGAILQQMSLPLSFLRDKSVFLIALQQGFQDALNVEEWVFIDTLCVV